MLCISQQNLTRISTSMSVKMSPVFTGGSILEVWRSKIHPLPPASLACPFYTYVVSHGSGHQQHHQGLGRQIKCPIPLGSVKSSESRISSYQRHTEVLQDCRQKLRQFLTTGSLLFSNLSPHKMPICPLHLPATLPICLLHMPAAADIP